MSNEHELETLNEQIGELAMRGLVLAAKQEIAALDEAGLGPIDLRSFLVGGIVATAKSGGVPEPLLAEMMKTFVEKIEPYLAAETSIEGAFDDLPVFDPGNGS